MKAFLRKQAIVMFALAVGAGALPFSVSADPAGGASPKSENPPNARVVDLHQTLSRRVKGGDPEAMANLATLLEQGDEMTPIDLTGAYDLYEAAAKRGNPVAVKKMCLAYLLGVGRAKDVKQASGFCNKVDGTDAVTFFWGGYDYQYGVTGPKDLDSAKAAYQEAFTNGSGEAADAIGQIAYDDGRFDVSRSWYRKGASLGSADAMAHLAGMLENGQGGRKDAVEAMWLYGYAAQRGNQQAQKWKQAHTGPEVPAADLGYGPSEITLTHTYGQGADQKTEPLTSSRLVTLMHTRLDGIILPGGDYLYYYAYFDCYVGVSREVDLCLTASEYPQGLGMGRILHAVWDGRITLPVIDAKGYPTAQSHFKSGVRIISD